MDKRQGGFEAWKGTPRAGTRVPIVTPYPAVSPELENERRRRQQAEADDEGGATPRPRAPPGLTVGAVRDALRILTRTPQRAALQRIAIARVGAALEDFYGAACIQQSMRE